MPDPLTLILLPGLDGTGELFAPLLPHLPAWLRPTVVSYPRDRFLSYDDLMPIVTAALPTDGGAFAVLGESFSGPLAVRVAAGRPAGLRGLVLDATFVRRPAPRVVSWLKPFMTETGFAVVPKWLRALPLVGPRPDRELRRLVDHAVDDVPNRVLAARMRETLRVDVRPDLARCGVPVLYLRGRYDVVVPRRNVNDVRSAQPATRVVTLETAHCVLQTKPAEAAAAIARFLSA